MAIVRCILIVLGLILGVVAVEFAARLMPTSWGDGRARFCEHHPVLGWIGKPYAHGRFGTPDFDTDINQNSVGLRGPEIPKEKSDLEKRILFLGDSFAWGFGVEQAERFSERATSQMPGVRAINSGCSGWGTDQEFIYYRDLGRLYQPDLVVVMMHLRSDLKNNVSSKQYGFHKPVVWQEGAEITFKNIPVPRSSLGYRATRFLSKHSAGWRLVAGREIGGVSLDERLSKFLNSVIGANEPTTVISNLSGTDATCRLGSMIRSEAGRDGARTLFVLIPDIEQGTNQIIESKQYSDLVLCLERASLEVLDLTPKFKEYFAEHPSEPLVFEHDLHWNRTGHTLVGEILATTIGQILAQEPGANAT